MLSFPENLARLLLLAIPTVTLASGARHSAQAIVAPCSGITLSASYLADVAPSHGPGLHTWWSRTSLGVPAAYPEVRCSPMWVRTYCW